VGDSSHRLPPFLFWIGGKVAKGDVKDDLRIQVVLAPKEWDGTYSRNSEETSKCGEA
jgi:hypothetical protein